MLAQTALIFAYQHIPGLVFTFCFGAVVGSFINVVVYRLPAGMSVISPPSRCPTCGARLAWRENFPIIGWLLIRGRCRHCGARVAAQYPLVELLMALLFTGLYAAYYMAGPSVPWWGKVGGEWWFRSGVIRSMPMFIAHLVLIAGLMAMTLIDARTFTIPIQVPLVITAVALVAAPVQGVIQALVPFLRQPDPNWPVPAANWQWFMTAAGGAIGIALSTVLLRMGVLRQSFADYEQHVPAGQTIGDYPHARREMLVEIIFLLPCLTGLAVGWFLGAGLPGSGPPIAVQALGGALLGYLVGGGLIWMVRIIATLAFGREAMGAGDIHLLAAVGAVLGATVPIWVFFLAPFSGLLWIAVSKGLLTVLRTARRELPYGPHLAVATLAVMACQPWIIWAQRIYLSFLPMPGLHP